MVLKVGSGEIDDLSTLNVLDEESLLRELRARYKKGIIYVSYSIVIYLNFMFYLSIDLYWRCTYCY
jgi:myosin heavy subunit